MSGKMALSKAQAGNSDSSKPQRLRRIRKWLSHWPTEVVSDNGEMVKHWCIRLVKEPGLAYCKYCKLKVNYTNKGLGALRRHASTMRHEDARTYHLWMTKGGASNQMAVKTQGKCQRNPSSSNQRHHPVSGQQTSAKVKLKGGKPDVIKNRPNQQQHLLNKHTILPPPVPRKSSSSSSSSVSTTLSPRYSVPVLSKTFLQFKTKPARPTFPTRHVPVASFATRHPTFPAKKATISGSALLYTNKIQPKLVPPKFYAPSGKHARHVVQQQHLSLPKFASSNSHRSSPAPALSLVLGNKQRVNANPNQVYSGANLSATRPPYFPQNRTVQRSIKLVPVFICYFCHEEFPSKSCLYQHQDQCTLKRESKTTTSTTIDNCSNCSIVATNTSTSTISSSSSSSSSSSVTSTMDASTSATMKPSSKTALKDVVIVLDKLPTTPDNPKQSTQNTFFPNPRTPQKTHSKSSPLPSSSSSMTQATASSWSYVNNTVSKPAFLNSLSLLPIKTALKEQKRISRKRRNTECESLDWVEEDELPPTPKTPCTPPTPKRLLSHLSREEYRRELPPHRLFRLSSSTSDMTTKKSEADSNDKDLVDTASHGGEVFKSSNSHKEVEEGRGGGGDTDARPEGKISVVRSLYNVDVTSLLGQFVVRHYKADPSLHILSDIESHCLTSPSANAKTTNFSLRARNVVYPIAFGALGRRQLFHDHYHSYKFNKSQVREFMKTANTGLNKDSRRLLRRMKKFQIALKRISKSDLKYWISSRNDITVDLKLLSPAEIAHWTSPKSTTSLPSVSSSEELDIECDFPDGLKSSSPVVKNVLGLKTKQVRIKTVNILSPSILNIANYVSEETCADLLSNRKTVYRSLLFDWAQNDSENVDVSNNSNVSTPSSQQQSKHQDNTILRRMLSQRPVLCSSLAGNTLPDITNLTMDKNIVAAAGVATLLPKLSQEIKPESKVLPTPKGKSSVQVDNRKSKVEVMKSRRSTRRNRIALMEESKNATPNKRHDANSASQTESKPLSVSTTESEKPSSKDENVDVDEVDSCSGFINLPNPSDLLREKTPSQNSDKSRQSSPEEATPSTSSTPTTSSTCTAAVRRRQSDRLRQGPKRTGVHSIEFQPPTTNAVEITSMESSPGLLKSFQEHFKCMRESEGIQRKPRVVSVGEEDSAGINENNKNRRSERKCGSSVSKERKVADSDLEGSNNGKRLDVLRSFLEGRLVVDSGGKDDKNSAKDHDSNVEAKGFIEAEKDGKTNTNTTGDEVKSTGLTSVVGDAGNADPPRLSRLSERTASQLGNVRLASRQRKSGTRVTGRAKKVGLNRRLSAAGLVKREGSLGSRSPVSSAPRSPVSSGVWRSPLSSMSRSPGSVSSCVSPAVVSLSMMTPVVVRSSYDSPTTTNAMASPLTPSSLYQSVSGDDVTAVHSSSSAAIDDGGSGLVMQNKQGLETMSNNNNASHPGSGSGSPPITLVIKRDRLRGRLRYTHKRESDRCSKDTDKGEEKKMEASPVSSKIRSSRIRRCSPISRLDLSSTSASSRSRASSLGAHCDKTVASVTRSRSSVSDTKRRGLPRRKCVVAQMLPSSSLSSAAAFAGKSNAAGASKSQLPTCSNASTSSNNSRRSLSIAQHKSNDGDGDQGHRTAASTNSNSTTAACDQEQHPLLPSSLSSSSTSSSSSSMSKGNLLKFFSSFKLM